MNAVECSRVKGYDVVVKFGKTMIHSFLKSQKPRFTLWFLRYEGKMEIIYKKLNDIKEYRNNPRKNDEAVGAVAESIKEFGFKVPIVIDKNSVIVAGNTRKKAAEELGLKAQETGRAVELCCAIGDEFIDGKPYAEIVDIARDYIKSVGGFEKFAEWGLVLARGHDSEQEEKTECKL